MNMLINETSKTTNLTKKAIEYYTDQKLIVPSVLENGYRDFSESDVECLKKISVLRKLGISTEEIKAILVDETGELLQNLSVQKELAAQKEQKKKGILDRLSRDKSYTDAARELEALEQTATIAERLLNAFPGYYGRFICLHFARFLNEPVKTSDQRLAYRKIMEFLDNMPSLSVTQDLQDYLTECTQHISTQNIAEMMENTKKSIENPDQFLSENKEYLERYLEFKQSEEYKNSPAFKIQNQLKEFNTTSGYYDVFIPSMKRLSASYEEYCRQMENANKKLIERYPEIAGLYD